MKHGGQFILILISVFLFHRKIQAENFVASDNPYTTIVARNIFNLVPMPTNLPADQHPADPPLKITPNGIMSLFGQLQVLFKVSVPPKLGQPPKDESYVLSVGERQDDIEVTKIDESAGIITFNNHGTIQELPLASAPNLSTPASPVGLAGGLMPPPNSQAGILPNRFAGGRFGNNRNLGNPNPAFGNEPNASAMPSYGATTLSGNNNLQSTENLTPEAQALMIEKNRIDTQDLVNKGLMPPLPITEITPPDATGPGGSPLIIPSQPKQ